LSSCGIVFREVTASNGAVIIMWQKLVQTKALSTKQGKWGYSARSGAHCRRHDCQRRYGRSLRESLCI